jgi:HPt (histidine-containing phosphotransfer) domain-containing protein
MLENWTGEMTKTSAQEEHYSMRTINGLRESIPKAQLQEIIALFFDHTKKKIASLEEAMRGRNIDLIESLSHSLKGSSANMGASLLFEYSNQILLDARNKEITQEDDKA